MSQLPNKDNQAHFVGVVEDIVDPLELGRIRVRIVNHNDNGTPVPTEELPWCSILGPVTSSSSEGYGSSPTWIQEGATVVGFYLDGPTKRLPIIQGTLWTIPKMDINNHSVHKLARGENTITKEPLGPEPESPYKAKYPFNKVQTTPGGHVIELDDTPEAERIHIYHKSGTYIEIGPDGTTVRKSVGSDIQVIAKDSSVHVEGKAIVYVKGDVEMKVDGSMNTEVAGDYNLKAGGNIKLEASRIDLN